MVEHSEGGGPHTSIVLSPEIKLDGKRSVIKISGAEGSEEMKGGRLSLDARAFVEEVTDLIEAKDEPRPRPSVTGDAGRSLGSGEHSPFCQRGVIWNVRHFSLC